jgi:hypothetical protein
MAEIRADGIERSAEEAGRHLYRELATQKLLPMPAAIQTLHSSA